MQVGGIGQHSPVPLPFGRPAAERAMSERADVVRGQTAAGAPAKASVPATEALTSAPPPGVDPALWSVLTTEERAYFAKVRALGPVTYGPSAGAAQPSFRGGRIDVTV